MQTCAACAAPLRDAARFCTQCGTAVVAAAVVEDAPPAPAPASPPTLPVPVARDHGAEIAPDPEPVLEPVPVRIAPSRRVSRPLARSSAATWALVAGIAPLALSVIGNVVSSQLGVAAVAQVEAGEPQGAWAPVLTVLALVFVGNAVLLTVCAISGVRGIRETANGVTRGRPLAIAGLAAGGVNLVLWVAGLVVTVSGLNVVLG